MQENKVAPCPPQRSLIVEVGLAKLVYDILQRLHAEFPQNNAVEEEIQLFSFDNGSLFKAMFAPFYTTCRASSSTVFKIYNDENRDILLRELSNVSFFERIDFSSLFLALTIENQQYVWRLISSITNFSFSLSQFSDEFFLKMEQMSIERRGGDTEAQLDMGDMVNLFAEALLNDANLMEEISQVARETMIM